MMRRTIARSLACATLLFAAVSAQQPGNGPPEYPWAFTTGTGGTNEQFLKKLAAAQASPEGSGLVVYGDSILQSLRFEDGPSKGAIAVGEKRFGKYNPLYFAVGGETPAALMGRLLDGVVPTKLGKTGDTAVLVNIGHNGLTGQGNSVNETASRIKSIIQYILDADPSNQVIAQGMLPSTGSDFMYKKGQMYGPQQQVNKELQAFAATNPRVKFVDCNPLFEDPKNPDMSNPELQPDGTHLSAQGFEVLADCVTPYIDEIAKSKSAGAATATTAAGVTAGTQQQQQQQGSYASYANGAATATAPTTAATTATATTTGTASGSSSNNPMASYAAFNVANNNNNAASAGAVAAALGATNGFEATGQQPTLFTSATSPATSAAATTGATGKLFASAAAPPTGTKFGAAPPKSSGALGSFEAQDWAKGSDSGSSGSGSGTPPLITTNPSGKMSTAEVLSFVQALQKKGMVSGSGAGVGGANAAGRRMLWAPLM